MPSLSGNLLFVWEFVDFVTSSTLVLEKTNFSFEIISLLWIMLKSSEVMILEVVSLL